MIRAIELVDYLKAKVPYTYFVNEFPPTSADDSAYVKITPGFPPSEWTTKKRVSFQIVVRGAEANMPYAESKALEIYKHLHNRNEFTLDAVDIGDGYYLGMGYALDEPLKRIIHCSADQSAPFYLGRDSNNRPLYSMNFTLVTLN